MLLLVTVLTISVIVKPEAVSRLGSTLT